MSNYGEWPKWTVEFWLGAFWQFPTKPAKAGETAIRPNSFFGFSALISAQPLKSGI
jgi:hypothetical protein